MNHKYQKLLEDDNYKLKMRLCCILPLKKCTYTIFDLKFYYSDLVKYYAHTLFCCYYEEYDNLR